MKNRIEDESNQKQQSHPSRRRLTSPRENRTKERSELLLIEGKTKAFRPATLIQQLSLAPLPLSPKELQLP